MKKRTAVVLALATLPSAATSASPFGTGWFAGADPDINRIVIPGENNGNPMFVVYVTGTRVFTSPDMITWRDRGLMLDIKDPNRNDVPWLVEGRAERGLWAPDMVVANGKYYLFYSVGPNSFGSEVAVAVCDSPLPPCRDTNANAGPLPVSKSSDFEAIDPMVFSDPKDGTRYLYLGGSAGSRMRVFRLGTNLTSIASEVANVPQPGSFTEGPFMHARLVDNVRTYYLSYSNGSWDRSNYNVKYVTSGSALGPWSSPTTILQSDNLYKGPGHHSILYNTTSQRWTIAYHRWEGRTGDGPYKGSDPAGPRKVAVARMTYSGTAIQPINMQSTAQ